jgi:hypothetical protein
MEANLAKRLAAMATIAALAVSGCATKQQVDGVNIVDCQKGPRTKATTKTLNYEDSVAIGGTSPGIGVNQPFEIGFGKGNAITVGNYSDNGWTLRYFPTSEPQLNNGEVGIDKSGTIFIRSLGVNYEIKSTIDSNSAVLDITATCDASSNPQQ